MTLLLNENHIGSNSAIFLGAVDQVDIPTFFKSSCKSQIIYNLLNNIQYFAMKKIKKKSIVVQVKGH